MQHAEAIVRKVGFLKTYLQELHGEDKIKWFKAFDLSCHGLIRMYELRWVLGSILE